MYRQLLEELAGKYYNIRPRRRRVTVGWCLVFVVLLTVSFGIYGIYCGGKALVTFCENVWENKKEEEIKDIGHMDAPDWSFKGGHREFPVKEKILSGISIFQGILMILTTCNLLLPSV